MPILAWVLSGVFGTFVFTAVLVLAIDEIRGIQEDRGSHDDENEL